MAAVGVRGMTPEEKEAHHRDAEAGIQVVSFSPPPPGKGPKDVVMLARTGRMRAQMQVVRSGGENNLHYHINSDTLWMVLKGRARFYGVGDKLLGEFGVHDGIVIPGGARYWFEKVGDEDLEILQTVAYQGKTERINIEAHKDWMDADDRLTIYE